MTGSELKIEVDEEGKVDMCKAIDDMKNMAKNEGKIETLVKLVKMKMLSLKAAAEVANMTKDEFSLKMKEIS